MKTLLKRNWIVSIILFVVLALLNPGMKRFREFTGAANAEYASYLRKTSNFIIFSLYKDDYTEEQYIGILMNFFNYTGKEEDAQNDPVSDSGKSSNDTGITSDTGAIITTDTVTIPVSVAAQNSSPSPYNGVVYHTRDGQIVSHDELLFSGYSEEGIQEGLQNGILTQIEYPAFQSNEANTIADNRLYKTKDGRIISRTTFKSAGYSEERIQSGVQRGIIEVVQ